MDKKDKAFILGAILAIGGILSLLIGFMIKMYFDFLLNILALKNQMPELEKLNSEVFICLTICLVLAALGGLITTLTINKKK